MMGDNVAKVDWKSLTAAGMAMDEAAKEILNNPNLHFVGASTPEESGRLVSAMRFACTMTLSLYVAITRDKVKELDTYMKFMIKSGFEFDSPGIDAFAFLMYQLGLLEEYLQGIGVPEEGIKSLLAVMDSIPDIQLNSECSVAGDDSAAKVREDIQRILGKS